ncbi:MAG TPA: hypothetical protein PK467_05800 [Candidatus Wallbacteria bacterium]|nr:hypothetical protein [Candidatus Wallbacteria bacterium]
MSEMINAAGKPQKLLEMGLLDEIIDICSLRAKISEILNGLPPKIAGGGNPILLV